MHHLYRLLPLIAAFLLMACAPQYNWRETHGNTIPFTVLLPAKPASFSRQIDLNGIDVTMTMTAAEVNGVTFAVGTATLPDAIHAKHALEAMQTGLLNNIGGTLRQASLPGQTSYAEHIQDMTAIGVTRGQPLLLMARLIAKDNRIYQVMVLGNEKAISEEIVDAFFTSFKPA